ncbi:hypothetical protein Amet_4697 [Alkaliphilus metalliredigens QYMF]|uniref:Uncharacterized protein n=1 Tax=Alkaliphilus metalliredigens (strain QYMF) TaxID=293826 RepID=A6TX47_ALKMQ|nr:hypothetical protein [Alkaliphilus metalliredigens]ABR50765.1 hypothetical protein Amet_4697 [Alkaliphilus metalliredigens QYMF]
MYNVAANLVNSSKEKAPTFVLSATKKVNPSKEKSVSPKELLSTTNHWGQGLYKDDLNFYESDSCSYLKVMK